MKKGIIVWMFAAMAIGSAFAQTGKRTIAVAKPHVGGVNIDPALVSKMIRLELVKLNEFTVYDEFDMSDVIRENPSYESNCFGQKCLVEFGQKLNVDCMMCGSVDGLYDKLAVSLKIIDVKNKTVFLSSVEEFENQEYALQRMIEMMLKDLFKKDFPEEVRSQLKYRNEPITSDNVSRINNSGPRIGIGILDGSLRNYAIRSEANGGMAVQPYVTMIGYQLEATYVGTENFSALVEGIFNVSGLEQGFFIPTLTVMNGFRFGKSGWEFAFGPGLGLRKMKAGFFDDHNVFGEPGKFYGRSEWYNYVNTELELQDGEPVPSPSDFHPDYDLTTQQMHQNGALRLSTSFVFGVGRTFRAGSLNIPVNLFYSAQKRSAIYGINVGFNVQKNKQTIRSL